MVFAQTILTNGTITTSGSSTAYIGFGNNETSLIINITGPVTGSSPAITFTIQEVDPGNGSTTLGVSKTGAAITGIGTQIITIPNLTTGSVIISWVVTGSTPSFGGIYATISDKNNTPYIYDIAGNGPVAVKAASTAALATDPAFVVAVSPNNTVSVTGTVTANNPSVSTTGTTPPASATYIGGSVTTAAPIYTTGQMNALSLTTGGLLRIDGSAVTQPVSGTVAATQSGTWTVQPGNTANTTPWLATINQGGNSAAVTASNALKIDGSAVTQPVSGTVTVTQSTAANLKAQTASESTTATSTGTVAGLVGGAVTTAAPTYTTGQMDPLSLTTAGALRIDGSGVTQPVSGTVAATQSGTWTVQPGNTANTTPWLATINQGGNSATVTASNALKIDGSAVTQPVSGTVTSNQGTANTLANAWSTKITDATNGPVAVKAASTAAVATDPALVVAVSPNNSVTVTQATAANLKAQTASEATTATTTGTVAGLAGGAVTTAAPTYTTGQMDPLSLTTAGALRTDSSATTQPVSGTVTANQGTANTLTNGWPVKVTDGTNTMPTADVAARAQFDKITDGTNTAAVKAASTAPVAADPALVVSVSPNTSLTVGISQSDVTATGSLGALNATVSIILAGTNNSAMQLVAGTLIGTIVPEVSVDGGTTWVGTYFDDPVTGNKSSSVVFASNNTATTRTIIGAGGASNARIRVSAYTSGTATCNLRASTTYDSTLTSEGSIGAATTPPTGVQIGGSNPLGSFTGAITSASGAIGTAIMGNEFLVQTNATVTTSGSQTITKNFYGVQQVNLVVNVTGSITGTTPTITYTIQELDPGNNTTVFGNSASTSIISSVGVYTAILTTTTSSSVKVSWTVTGSSPSFGGVYATVISKATPSSQQITTSATAAIPGNAQGYTTTSATTNVVLQATTYTEQSANFTGSIASASANDTSAGTGARTVRIFYVDATGATAGTEDATLNGTTGVNLVTTTKCFIEKIQVLTVGSTGSNVGIISLYSAAAKGGTVIATIAATDNQTYLGHHYVVSGKTCNISGITGFNNNGSNQSVFTLQSTVLPVANQASVQVSDWVTGGLTFQVVRLYDQLIKVSGPARIQMFVQPGGTPTILNRGSFDYYDQ